MEIDDAANSIQLTLDVLRVVTEERNTYGLRRQDYDKYRNHCSRKIHRLRQSTSLVQTKGKKYHHRSITSTTTLSEQHALLVLFEAERAWAYARDILTIPTTSPNSTSSAVKARQRQHGIRRLIRSVQYAQTLLSLVTFRTKTTTDVATIRCYVSVQVYVLYMQGFLAFTKSSFEVGLDYFSSAWLLLDDLSQSTNETSLKALSYQWADEVTPLARYCAYQLDIKTMDVATLCKERASNGGGAKVVKSWNELRSALSEQQTKLKGQLQQDQHVSVKWKGQVLQARHAELSELLACGAQALTKLNVARQQLSKSQGKVDKLEKGSKSRGQSQSALLLAYDAALLSLSDAEASARKLVQEASSNSVTATTTSTTTSATQQGQVSLVQGHGWLTWHLLATRLSRDTLLLESAGTRLQRRLQVASRCGKSEVTLNRKKAKAWPGIARLLNAMIEATEALREVSLVEEDSELTGEVECKISYLKAQRCVLVARAHELAGKHAEALLLTSRGFVYARQARDALMDMELEPDTSHESDSTQLFLPLQSESIDDVEVQLRSVQGVATRHWFNQTGGHPDRLTADDVTKLSLDDDKSKADFKVFDVAFNYVVQLPMDALAASAGLEAATAVQKSSDAPRRDGAVTTPTSAPPPSSKKSGVWGFFSRG